jgi:hypothetical protein
MKLNILLAKDPNQLKLSKPLEQQIVGGRRGGSLGFPREIKNMVPSNEVDPGSSE